MDFEKNKIFIGGIVLALVAIACFWYSQSAEVPVALDIVPAETVIPPDPLAERVTESGALESIPPITAPAELVAAKPWEKVFFTSQAPTGDWTKSEFQDGCEEASALMVHAWATGKTYTKEEVKEELLALARYQEKQIGQGVDTDAADTAEILLDGYFYISDYRLAYDFTLEDLKAALKEGLVIVPTNGRALKNPNFTRPGPLQHMLVVTGYDALKKEFITNDPGTSRGSGYRYPEAVLFSAIREYPTGKHLPIEKERTAMIIIPSAPLPVTP